MRTVTYKSVQDSVFRNAGIDPVGDTLTTAQNNSVADFINERVREAIEFAWWPELMRIEERAYRKAWSAANTYAAGDEVYYGVVSDLYYVAVRGNTNVTPGTSAADWTLTSLTNKYIELNRLGETAIGEVKEVTKYDPRTTRSPMPVGYTIGENGIQFDSAAPETVWVEFRLQPPVFTSTAWSGTATYAEGSLVLNDDGEVYKAILVGGLQYWLKVEMPFVISSFVKRAATADYLNMVGQTAKAEIESKKAEGALLRSIDTVFGGQGMYQTASVETY